jgi:uncharacterized protein (DUF433 family)
MVAVTPPAKEQLDMNLEPLIDRITVDPTVCGGRPCLRGGRIWASLLLERIADGASLEEVAAELGLTIDDVRACCAYAGMVLRSGFGGIEPA